MEVVMLSDEALKATVVVRPVWRDCRSCKIKSLAQAAGICCLCATLVHEVDNGGVVWVYARPILNGNGDVITAARSDLSPAPRLLAVE